MNFIDFVNHLAGKSKEHLTREAKGFRTISADAARKMLTEGRRVFSHLNGKLTHIEDHFQLDEAAQQEATFSIEEAKKELVVTSVVVAGLRKFKVEGSEQLYASEDEAKAAAKPDCMEGNRDAWGAGASLPSGDLDPEEKKPAEPTYANGTVTQSEIDAYLEELRQSGETNMFGAGPYVEAAFDMDKREARAALGYWMKHYKGRNESRVNEMSSYTRLASTDEQEGMIADLEKTLAKLGKRIRGATTIGKSPQTVILDLTHQGSEMYIYPSSDYGDARVEINDQEVDPSDIDDVKNAIEHVEEGKKVSKVREMSQAEEENHILADDPQPRQGHIEIPDVPAEAEGREGPYDVDDEGPATMSARGMREAEDVSQLDPNRVDPGQAGSHDKKIYKLPAFTLDQIMTGYVGRPHTCMCGCAGEYSRTTAGWNALKKDDYRKSDQPNDVRVKRIYNKMKKHESRGIEVIGDYIYTLYAGTRQYTIYLQKEGVSESVNERGHWHAPLDPDCPEVEKYHEGTDDDPIMAMSGCAGEFYSDFANKHRSKCQRCQQYGAANIEASYESVADEAFFKGRSSFHDKGSFIDYLKDTLIPDLRASGNDATADDFEEAIHWMEKVNDSKITESEMQHASNMVGFLVRQGKPNATIESIFSGTFSRSQLQGLIDSARKQYKVREAAKSLTERAWKYTLNFNFLKKFNDREDNISDEEVKEAAKLAIAEIQKLQSMFKDEHLKDQMQQAIDEFEMVETQEEFNNAMSLLYDVADGYDIWVDTMNFEKETGRTTRKMPESQKHRGMGKIQEGRTVLDKKQFNMIAEHMNRLGSNRTNEAVPVKKKQDPFMPSSGCDYCGKDDTKVTDSHGDYCSDECMKAAQNESVKEKRVDDLCMCNHLKSEHGGSHGGLVPGHGACNNCGCKQFTWKEFVYDTIEGEPGEQMEMDEAKKVPTCPNCGNQNHGCSDMPDSDDFCEMGDHWSCGACGSDCKKPDYKAQNEVEESLLDAMKRVRLPESKKDDEIISNKKKLASILRKIHKATDDDDIDGALDLLMKHYVTKDANVEAVKLIQAEAERKRSRLAKGDKAETPESETDAMIDDEITDEERESPKDVEEQMSNVVEPQMPGVDDERLEEKGDEEIEDDSEMEPEPELGNGGEEIPNPNPEPDDMPVDFKEPAPASSTPVEDQTPADAGFDAVKDELKTDMQEVEKQIKIGSRVKVGDKEAIVAEIKDGRYKLLDLETRQKMYNDATDTDSYDITELGDVVLESKVNEADKIVTKGNSTVVTYGVDIKQLKKLIDAAVESWSNGSNDGGDVQQPQIESMLARLRKEKPALKELTRRIEGQLFDLAGYYGDYFETNDEERPNLERQIAVAYKKLQQSVRGLKESRVNETDLVKASAIDAKVALKNGKKVYWKHHEERLVEIDWNDFHNIEDDDTENVFYIEESRVNEESVDKLKPADVIKAAQQLEASGEEFIRLTQVRLQLIRNGKVGQNDDFQKVSTAIRSALKSAGYNIGPRESKVNEDVNIRVGDRVQFTLNPPDSAAGPGDWEGGNLSYEDIESLDGKVGTVVAIDVAGQTLPDSSDYVTVEFEDGKKLEAASEIHFTKVEDESDAEDFGDEYEDIDEPMTGPENTGMLEATEPSFKDLIARDTAKTQCSKCSRVIKGEHIYRDSNGTKFCRDCADRRGVNVHESKIDGLMEKFGLKEKHIPLAKVLEMMQKKGKK